MHRASFAVRLFARRNRRSDPDRGGSNLECRLEPERRVRSRVPAAAFSSILMLAAGCVAPGERSATLAGVRFDHCVVFAEDAALQEWLEVHLTNAEALETRHEGQGTRGRYFLFLNSFLEVLTLEDAAEAASNEDAFGSPYVPRWRDDHAAPIAFGLTLDSDSFASPPFDHVRYRGNEDGGGYVMAKGNVDLAAPLVYATGPARAYRRRTSMEELRNIEDASRREEVRRYLTHPCGVRTLTHVTWRAPGSGVRGPNADLLRSFPEVTLEPGAGHELILEFDHAAAGQELRFEGRPSVVLRF